MKRSLLISAACGLCAFYTPAHAQGSVGSAPARSAPAAVKTKTVSFNIPGQDLQRALLALTRQAGVQLVVNPADVRGLKSVPVVGRHSPDRAAQIMLDSLPISAEWVGDDTLVIERRSASFKPVAVNASAQDLAPTQAPLVAQPAETQGESGLQDIVVTAQKRATNLQKTPITIAVLGSEDLENRHIVSLENIGASIPAVQLSPFIGRSSAIQVTIRGIGAQADANQPLRDQAVGVYMDGVYLGRAQGLGTALYDIERIEVLKGPQGTLFGRNTSGGAISIVSRAPSGEFSMDTTLGLSKYDGYEAKTHINLPRFQDFSVKFSALLNKRGGTMKNPLAGEPDFQSFNKRGLHAAVLWEPADDFDATYAFDTSYDASTPGYQQLTHAGTAPLAPIIRPHKNRIKVADVGLPLRLSVGKTSGHTLNLAWKASPKLTLKSISAFRRLNQSQFANNNPNRAAFVPNGIFGRDSQAHLKQRQYSQEMQIIGDLPRVNFVSGAYYFYERLRDDAWSPDTLRWNATGTDYTLLPAPIGQTPFPDRDVRAKASSAAAFVQATWTPALLNDTVHLTGGVRYTHDKKSGALLKVNGATPTLNGVTAPLQFKDSWNRLDKMVNLAVDVGRDAMIYGKWSTGYRSGGANPRSLTFSSFDPETVSSFEVGAKTQWFDRRVRANIAAYASRVKDQQLDFSFVSPSINRSTLETVNANGTGKIKGAEVEITLAPTRRLTISGAYAYIDVKLPSAPNPFIVGSPPADIFSVYTPKHSASGAIDYEVPIGELTFRTHLDANFATRQYQSPNNPNQLVDKTFLVNGRLALDDIRLRDDGATMQLSVWARNLFNRSDAIIRGLPAAGGGFSAVFNEPRTYGFQANIRF